MSNGKDKEPTPEEIKAVMSYMGKIGGSATMAKKTPEELAEFTSAGGRARAASLTPERRSEIAQKASKAAAKARTAKAKAKRAAKKVEKDQSSP